MNKKGVLGLKTAISFILVLLTLVIIAFLSVLIYNALLTSGDRIASKIVDIRYNETLVTVDDVAVTYLTSRGAREGTISGVIVTNETSGDIIPSSNYTLTSNCDSIIYSAPVVASTPNYNGTNWNITFSCTHISSDTANIIGNVSSGTVSLFANATTWFALMGIVIIILIIAIVIVTVRGFEGKGTGEGKSGEFEGL